MLEQKKSDGSTYIEKIDTKPEEIVRSRILLSVMTKALEAFSNGKFSLHFDIVEIDATVTSTRDMYDQFDFVTPYPAELEVKYGRDADVIMHNIIRHPAGAVQPEIYSTRSCPDRYRQDSAR